MKKIIVSLLWLLTATFVNAQENYKFQSDLEFKHDSSIVAGQLENYSLYTNEDVKLLIGFLEDKNFTGELAKMSPESIKQKFYSQASTYDPLNNQTKREIVDFKIIKDALFTKVEIEYSLLKNEMDWRESNVYVLGPKSTAFAALQFPANISAADQSELKKGMHNFSLQDEKIVEVAPKSFPKITFESLASASAKKMLNLLSYGTFFVSEAFAAEAATNSTCDTKKYIIKGDFSTKKGSALFNFQKLAHDIQSEAQKANPSDKQITCLGNFYKKAKNDAASYWSERGMKEGCLDEKGNVATKNSKTCSDSTYKEMKASFNYIDNVDKSLNDFLMNKYTAEATCVDNKKPDVSEQMKVFTKLNSDIQQTMCCSDGNGPMDKGPLFTILESEDTFKKLSPTAQTEVCLMKTRTENKSFQTPTGMVDCLSNLVDGIANLVKSIIKTVVSVFDVEFIKALGQFVANLPKSAVDMIHTVGEHIATQVYSVVNCMSKYEQNLYMCKMLPSVAATLLGPGLVKNFIKALADKTSKTALAGVIAQAAKGNKQFQQMKAAGAKAAAGGRKVASSAMKIKAVSVSAAALGKIAAVLGKDISTPIEKMVERKVKAAAASASAKAKSVAEKILQRRAGANVDVDVDEMPDLDVPLRDRMTDVEDVVEGADGVWRTAEASSSSAAATTATTTTSSTTAVSTTASTTSTTATGAATASSSTTVATTGATTASTSTAVTVVPTQNLRLTSNSTSSAPEAAPKINTAITNRPEVQRISNSNNSVKTSPTKNPVDARKDVLSSGSFKVKRAGNTNKADGGLDEQGIKALDDFTSGTHAQSAKKLAVELKSLNQAQFLNKMDKLVEEGKSTKSIIKLANQDMVRYEFPDGSMVRYMPEGDFQRKGPTYVIEVNKDKLPDTGDSNHTAFKVNSKGEPIPKNPRDIELPSSVVPNTPEAENFIRSMMDQGHIRLATVAPNPKVNKMVDDISSYKNAIESGDNDLAAAIKARMNKNSKKLDDNERIAVAEAVNKGKAVDGDGVVRAHEVGGPGRELGSYNQSELRLKAREAQKAGIDRNERRDLMEAGVLGGDTPGKIPSLITIQTPAGRIPARVLESNGDKHIIEYKGGNGIETYKKEVTTEQLYSLGMRDATPPVVAAKPADLNSVFDDIEREARERAAAIQAPKINPTPEADLKLTASSPIPEPVKSPAIQDRTPASSTAVGKPTSSPTPETFSLRVNNAQKPDFVNRYGVAKADLDSGRVVKVKVRTMDGVKDVEGEILNGIHIDSITGMPSVQIKFADGVITEPGNVMRGKPNYKIESVGIDTLEELKPKVVAKTPAVEPVEVKPINRTVKQPNEKQMDPDSYDGKRFRAETDSEALNSLLTEHRVGGRTHIADLEKEILDDRLIRSKASNTNRQIAEISRYGKFDNPNFDPKIYYASVAEDFNTASRAANKMTADNVSVSQAEIKLKGRIDYDADGKPTRVGSARDDVRFAMKKQGKTPEQIKEVEDWMDSYDKTIPRRNNVDKAKAAQEAFEKLKPKFEKIINGDKSVIPESTFKEMTTHLNNMMLRPDKKDAAEAALRRIRCSRPEWNVGDNLNGFDLRCR